MSVSLSRRDLARQTSVAMLAAGTAPGAAAAAVPPRLSAEDRLDIIELMARYAWAYDTANEAGLAGTFTPDGELEVFGRVMAGGRLGFAAFLATAAQMRGAHGWQHQTNNHVFTAYDGEACTVFSYYLMPESDAQGGDVHLRAMGYYESRCRRTAHGWRFARRAVTRWNGKQPF
jgi:hypothetical protein